MRKFLKIFGISVGVLVAAFIVWCFIPEDDDGEYEDAQYEDTDRQYDDLSQTETSDSSSSGPVATAISEEQSQAKQELLDAGIIRSSQVKLKGNGDDTVTVLVYMNGSNLETEGEEASTDLSEMVAAGSSDKVNVLVQTMGTKQWSDKYSIASDRTQRYKLSGDGLTLISDDLGQLDCTESSTLSDFIKWGTSAYPADRYILLLWDHGGGPVYGFGYDEWQEEDTYLSVDELKSALTDAGTYFDFIGMDCCIMSCLEVGCALYDYCDYLILSEDFESYLGWSYTDWMSVLYDNPSVPTTDLGPLICNTMVEANEDDSDGDDSIMALIDVAMMKVLYTAWVNFAYANEDTLLQTNYSQELSRSVNGGRIHPMLLKRSGMDWDYGYEDYYDEENPQMAEYYVTDIMAVAQNIDSEESEALSAAVSETLIYTRASSGDSTLTGLSVTLPYGDSDFYSEMKTVFTNIGIDSDYITWLNKFTSVANSVGSYDYSDWGDAWDGMDEYQDDYSWDDWDYYSDDEYWSNDECWGWDDSECCYDDGYYDDGYYDDGYYDDGYYDDGYYDDGYYDDGYYGEGPDGGPGGGPPDEW